MAAAVGTAFLSGLRGYDRPLPALLAGAGWGDLVRFWLALLGGVPSLGSRAIAPFVGAAALVAALWLGRRRAFGRRDLFLSSLALWVFGSTLLISYGRFGSPLLPPSSSRYMVQSAVLWSVLGLLGLKELPPRFFARGAVLLLLLAGALNVAADLRFKEEAAVFLDRRRLAVHQYLRTGTLQGAPSIYPDAAVADRLLAAARESKIYCLNPRVSSAARVAEPIRESELDHWHRQS